MFIGVFMNQEKRIENYIYYSFEEWYKDTFSPVTEIYSFLEKNAKRYGLLREFKENCII